MDEAFGSMTLFDTTGTIAHSTTLVGLTPATTYDFYTRCVGRVTCGERHDNLCARILHDRA